MKTILRIIATVGLTVFLLMLAGCESRRTDKDESGERRNETVEVEVERDREKSEIRAELQELKDDINRELEKVDREIERSSAETRVKLERIKRDLEDERNDVEIELNKVDESGAETWEEVKAGARNTAMEVRNGFRKLGNEIADLVDGDEEEEN